MSTTPETVNTTPGFVNSPTVGVRIAVGNDIREVVSVESGTVSYERLRRMPGQRGRGSMGLSSWRRWASKGKPWAPSSTDEAGPAPPSTRIAASHRVEFYGGAAIDRYAECAVPVGPLPPNEPAKAPAPPATVPSDPLLQPSPASASFEPLLLHYPSEAAWRDDRVNAIGASEAAMLMGESKWGGQFALYVRKKVGEKGGEDSRQRAGKMLEPAIAAWAADVLGGGRPGHVAIEPNGRDVYVHPEDPWLRCTPDYWLTFDGTAGRFGLECKNTGGDQARGWPRVSEDGWDIVDPGQEVGLPSDAEWQVHHQMAVTGADRWYLAALLWGNDLRIWCIERDEDAIALLREEARRFWHEHVEADVYPPISEADREPVKLTTRLHPAPDGSTVDLPDLEWAARAACTWGAERRSADTAERKAKATLAAAMRDAETATVGGFKVTYKTNQHGGRTIRVSERRQKA